MADGFKQIIGGILVTVLGFYGVLHAQWIDVTNPNNPCGQNINQATYYQIIDNDCYAVFENSATWAPPDGTTIEYALIGGGGGSKGGLDPCPMGGTTLSIDGITQCTLEITDTSTPKTVTPSNYNISSFYYLLIGGGGGTGGGTGSNAYPNPLNAHDGGSVLGEKNPANDTYLVTVGGGGEAGSHTWEMPIDSGSATPGKGGANGGSPGERINYTSESFYGPGGSGGSGGITKITTNSTVIARTSVAMGSLGGANKSDPSPPPPYATGPVYDYYKAKYGMGGQYFGDRNGKDGVAVIRYDTKVILNRKAGPAGFIKGKFTASSSQPLKIVIGKGGGKGTWEAAGTSGESTYSSTSYGVGGTGGKAVGNPGGGGGGGASVIQIGSSVKLVAPGGAGGGGVSNEPSEPNISFSTTPAATFPGAHGVSGGGGGGGGEGGGGGAATVATAGKFYIDYSFSSATTTSNAKGLLSSPTLRPQSLGNKNYGQIQIDGDGVDGVAIFKYPAQYNFTDIALATSNTYPIIVNAVKLTSSLSAGEFITIAVVGGSDPSDELTIPTRNTPTYSVVNASSENLDAQNNYYQVNQYMSGWGESTSATPEPMNLRGVMRLQIKAPINAENLNTILKSIRLKTNGYRRHKIIAFLKGRDWKCYNARTISDNYRIECSQYTSNQPSQLLDSDHGLTWQKKVLVSPNEGAAGNFDNVCDGYQISAAQNIYETDQASTLSGWVNAGRVLASPTTQTNSVSSCAYELTTAGLEQQDTNKIHYRLHILRPNPILHAIPF